MDEAQDVRTFIDSNADQWLAGLQEWLRIPSQSGDPALAGEVRRSAEWLATALREAGFPTVEVWETPGLPAVYAEWPADDAGAPVALVYGHHDVQPVEPLEQWTAPPYDPVVVDGRLLGRGAADDKGQVAMHLLGLRAHLAATGRSAPAATVKVLVEGEEESGSPHFVDLLRAQRERLRCDVVVVSDTGLWRADVPSTVIGLRGLVSCQLDLVARDVDLHSGSFGGAVLNPATALARMLATLHDESGHVAVPGFYDSVLEPGEEERAMTAALPYDEAQWLADAHSTVPAGEAGWSTLERVWVRPTAEVNGYWAGHTGAGTKTIIPREAHAKLSFRLVAAQEPDQVRAAVEAWAHAAAPAGATVTLTWEGDGVRPCATPLGTPALQALHRAMARAWGTDVLVTREGGSGPEADLQDVLEAPLVYLGVSLPDSREHAPNENVPVEMLLKGAESAAYFWSELAAQA
ncbi:M20/M25/M40 family metallo-hydrolase [Motilibacter rhizosphaerae]|uniref:M20/M25/M40 family metallo-hydrolase n=1 Tax=Motilibacter rhizosphaerae TaxID=598652 RepID=UPI00102BCA1F|nr:M20/M25/M40 family metallo-hydrolase [Motilibacter rhizosphaerae]